MNCYKHPDQAAKGECSHCRAPMCAECLSATETQNAACVKCVALLASKEVATDIVKERAEAIQRQDKLQHGKKRKKKSILALQLLTIVAAIVVVFWQIPVITNSLAPEKPVRIGTYATNEITDQCIDLLWKTSQGLQNGVLPGPDTNCPASDTPLQLSEENGDVVVRVPDPERYGFREIRVTRKNPVPEVIQ